MRSEEEEKLCKGFGRNLASVRNQLHWSQERLALESGLARSYISDVERGIRNVALVNIFRLADTLGVDVLTLMAFRQRNDKAGNQNEPRSAD